MCEKTNPTKIMKINLPEFLYTHTNPSLHSHKYLWESI